MTRERFEQGMTYDEYKAQMTRNRETFEENERSVELSAEDRDAFSKVARLHVLVLTEDWCGDAIANLPILGRVASESGGRLDLRVFLRDQNEDLMAQYMNGEFKSIPVFAFFDDDFNERGRFIERPASVTALRATRRAEIFADHPEFGRADGSPAELPEDVRAELTRELQKMRAETKPFADREVIRELREILTRAAA